MLTIQDLHVHYGAIHALKGVNLHVKTGEIVTLIGSNGAGKTTLVRSISGLLRPSQGRMEYETPGLCIDLCRTPSHRIVAHGIAQVPEGRMIFANLSVKENLELGAYGRSDRKNFGKDMERVFGLFPRLRERIAQNAGTLSGGEQQMLAIGRALMSRPCPADFQNLKRDQQGRDHTLVNRTGRLSRPGNRGPRLCLGDRRDYDGREGLGPAQGSEDPQGLFRGFVNQSTWYPVR